LSLTPAHKAGRKLQKTFKEIRAPLFVFVTNRGLTATNNGSERALRASAIYRKITNGFRSEWVAKLSACDPSSKPEDGVASVLSTPSASPSKAPRSSEPRESQASWRDAITAVGKTQRRNFDLYSG